MIRRVLHRFGFCHWSKWSWSSFSIHDEDVWEQKKRHCFICKNRQFDPKIYTKNAEALLSQHYSSEDVDAMKQQWNKS